MKKLIILLLAVFVCININKDINSELFLLGAYLRPTGTSDIISRVIDVIAKLYFKIKSIFKRN